MTDYKKIISGRHRKWQIMTEKNEKSINDGIKNIFRHEIARIVNYDGKDATENRFVTK